MRGHSVQPLPNYFGLLFATAAQQRTRVGIAPIWPTSGLVLEVVDDMSDNKLAVIGHVVDMVKIRRMTS